MTSGFSNPIAGGDGRLIINAVQSDNFVSGSTGWEIAKDGTAEFNNVTVRGKIEDGQLFIYSGTPALGNLVTSISPTSGVDEFGNHYNSGYCSYYNASLPVGWHEAVSLLQTDTSGNIVAEVGSLGSNGPSIALHSPNDAQLEANDGAGNYAYADASSDPSDVSVDLIVHSSTTVQGIASLSTDGSSSSFDVQTSHVQFQANDIGAVTNSLWGTIKGFTNPFLMDISNGIGNTTPIFMRYEKVALTFAAGLATYTYPVPFPNQTLWGIASIFGNTIANVDLYPTFYDSTHINIFCARNGAAYVGNFTCNILCFGY